MLRFASSLVGSALATFLLVPDATAQIELTESDERTLVGERVGIQVFAATSPSSFSSFFTMDGGNLTFDFTPYEYETVFSGYQQWWTAQNAPPDVPFLSHFENRGANVIVETRFEDIQTQETTADSSAWQFFEITSSETAQHGFGAVYAQDLDQDGESPDSARAEWTPARVEAPLPLNYEDVWEQENDLSFSVSSLPTISSYRNNEIDAWGTLKTPFGSAPALMRRANSADTISLGGNLTVTKSTTLSFITKDGRLGGSITRDDNTGQITGVQLKIFANDGESFQVSQGESPSLSGPDAQVKFTQGSSTSGTLGIYRFDTNPFNNIFSGSATSDDGTSVTPDVVWEGRYFVIRNQGLQDFSADVCVDISNTPGVNDAGKLVLLSRTSANNAWSPLNSSLDGNQLCATVSEFSQFAVGSNSSDNELPVELNRFEAHAEGSKAVLTWQTASETNNAGFEIQRRVRPASSWSTVHFVEGAGTTSDPHSYQFTDRDLPYGAETIRYRLKQVDLDGSSDLSETVKVRLGDPTQLALRAPFPNPAQNEATIRFELPEATEVQLTVYDLLGQRVATLIDGPKKAGRAQVQLHTQDLPSGTYLLRLRTADQTRSERLTVVK